MSVVSMLAGVGLLSVCCLSSSVATTMMGGEKTTSTTMGPTGPAPPPPPPEGVTNVRYVRLERPSVDYPGNIINLSEVEVYDENGTNIAEGKTVTGGPGAAHGAGPFARLVDGIKTPTNFAHTTGSGASFMQIDLGTATTVKKIVITNRLNCCQRRTENMKVKLLDANNTVLKTTNAVNKGQKEMTIDFSATTPTWEYLAM
ncbi:hypothetical protein OlV1_137c [Ostreococcus lucimarinus virus 1]|uniref:hypothetical protein n=1 Tax=Ostreococcus lucimarinus virus 1 TaxID=880162 RepID=UPI0001EF460E|nr:hypothetical protein OlV1_137c [Ostreococcus lucimarinus virus 1]ADQ91514.1 hypothetical protein OlV1_137c [Ostreococcus lucimarinus virus 1]